MEYLGHFFENTFNKEPDGFWFRCINCKIILFRKKGKYKDKMRFFQSDYFLYFAGSSIREITCNEYLIKQIIE